MKVKDLGIACLRVNYTVRDFSFCGTGMNSGCEILCGEDEIALWFPCPNATCTSRGFSLMNLIKKASAMKETHVTGILFCSGRENGNAKARDCANWMEYDIYIDF